jgi:hypothetical protein
MFREKAIPPGGKERPAGKMDNLSSITKNDDPASQSQGNRKILIVSREARFSESVVNYAVNLAERLGYDLIALNVGANGSGTGIFHSPYQRYLAEKFKKQAQNASSEIQARLTAKGLGFEHLVRFGDFGAAVEALNHEKKRIEFVLNASEMSEAEMMGGVSLPVFTIKGNQGDMIMAKESSWNGKLIGQTLAWGLGTVALYAAVFLNAGTVMNYFTRGGWYAALPVGSVFLFSYVHGSFSNNVWEVLGIRAPQKTVQPQPTAERPVRRQRTRPRLRLNV